jgi:hypothetical protein
VLLTCLRADRLHPISHQPAGQPTMPPCSPERTARNLRPSCCRGTHRPLSVEGITHAQDAASWLIQRAGGLRHVCAALPTDLTYATPRGVAPTSHSQTRDGKRRGSRGPAARVLRQRHPFGDSDGGQVDHQLNGRTECLAPVRLLDEAGQWPLGSQHRLAEKSEGGHNLANEILRAVTVQQPDVHAPV